MHSGRSTQMPVGSGNKLGWSRCTAVCTRRNSIKIRGLSRAKNPSHPPKVTPHHRRLHLTVPPNRISQVYLQVIGSDFRGLSGKGLLLNTTRISAEGREHGFSLMSGQHLTGGREDVTPLATTHPIYPADLQHCGCGSGWIICPGYIVRKHRPSVKQECN